MSKKHPDPIIQQVSVMRAGPAHFAAYRVRDPETNEWSSIQFHLTYDNTVMAVMGEESAKFFALMVTRTLANQSPRTCNPVSEVLATPTPDDVVSRGIEGAL